MVHTLELSFGSKTLSLETGRVARQAHGACIARLHDSLALASVVADDEPRPGISFFPLTVEFRVRAAASGRIPGAFGRREGRLSTFETLTSRVIDRSLRPLFPDGYRCETQVVAQVLSADPEGDPEMLAANAAAAAVMLSDVPWGGPVCFVRLAQVGGRWILFPTPAEREIADLDLVVAESPDGVVMLEGCGQQVSEEVFLEALDEAHACLAPNLEKLLLWRQQVGKAARAWQAPAALPGPGRERIEAYGERLREALAGADKAARGKALSALKAEVLETFAAEERALAGAAFKEFSKKTIREATISSKRRIDGRGFEDIRQIDCEAGWLPRTHGSSLFTRGETQAMLSCTLGGPFDELREDTLFSEARRSFFLHYNFPAYSVGEVRAMRGPGRREIGHGTLAYQALLPVVPGTEDFPYTIRLVSDISESNGSSSMASVCGGSLALMDAGVPIVAPVAGIAMGLMQEGAEFAILSDILGDEDHIGDMDFKVAGTHQGITAVQLDNKLGSLPRAVLEQAMQQARRGRLHILAKMAEALAEARPEVSPHAPRMSSLKIRKNRIRGLIGARGANLKDIEQRTGAKLDVGKQGMVRISAPDAQSGREAYALAIDLAGEVELDQIYRAQVETVKDFGCFVRIYQGVEGMVHISDLADRSVEDARNVVKVGDFINVRVMGADHAGRLQLSHRAAQGAVASNA